MDRQNLAASIVRFIEAVEPMKNHTRTAWGSTGRAESVAEHSWRLAMLAMIVGPHLPGVDASRLLELCLVHDLGETFEGDISAPEQDGTAAKTDAEQRAVSTLADLLPDKDGSRIRKLWREYDAARTPEARAAKALDKLETILQHNQGSNPADFDYAFNLGYGAGLEHEGSLLKALRAIADEQTRVRAKQQ